MRKLHEYREHAAECREMARTAPPSHRQQLEQMAATWEQLAVARQRKLLKGGKARTSRLARTKQHAVSLA